MIYVNVPMETSTFLAAVCGMFALVLVLFLYVNRKWCFHRKHGGCVCCVADKHGGLPSKYIVQKMARHRPYENHTSSDSEEEILRRLRMQQSAAAEAAAAAAFSTASAAVTGSAMNQCPTNYGGTDSRGRSADTRISVDSLRLQKKHQLRLLAADPLGIAERGKVGIPTTSSDCSSNSSVDDSTTNSKSALLLGSTANDSSAKKPRLTTGRSFDSNALRETRIEHHQQREPAAENSRRHGERRNSTNSSEMRKYRKLGRRLDSLDNVPGLSNNNINSISLLSQEPLFDTSDLQSIKSDVAHPSSVSLLCGTHGSIEISLMYDAPMRKMTVHVIQARGIPSRDGAQQTHSQVRLLMLPNKKQKHKTKIRSGDNPQFCESFLLHRVNPEEVNSMGLRVRVYGCERMRRERLIGESIVSFATIDLELETNLYLPLETRSSTEIPCSTSDLLSLARSDSTSSTTSMQHGGVPELLLALGYNGVTGRLTVEIVKGCQFRNLSLNKAPDTYVKLCLVSSLGHELARAKTSTQRGQPNPLYKESFVFQVALFQLNDVTLMVSVYAKHNMKRNEMVGWFSLGLNCSGPEEVDHWAEIRESTRGDLIARWHILMDS